MPALNCVLCEKRFFSWYGKVSYCSTECKKTASDEKAKMKLEMRRLRVPKQKVITKVDIIREPRACKYCQVEFTPSHGNQLACTRACGSKFKTTKKPTDEQKEERRQKVNAKGLRRTAQKHADNPGTCKYCKSQFIKTNGNKEYCSQECQSKRNNKVAREKVLSAPKPPKEIGICGYCSKEYEKRSVNHKYCSDRCGNRVNKIEDAKRERVHRLENPKICKECGLPFNYTDSRQTFCGRKCRDKFNNRGKVRDRGRDERHRRERISRLKSNGAYDHDLTLVRLVAKSHGVCAICKRKVDYKDSEWRNGTFIVGSNYPSIDHVKPVSKGGTHTWNNVQLAHIRCNSIKGSNTAYETQTGQLKLSV